MQIRQGSEDHLGKWWNNTDYNENQKGKLENLSKWLKAKEEQPDWNKVMKEKRQRIQTGW